jgi:hypothetical protein
VPPKNILLKTDIWAETLTVTSINLSAFPTVLAR